MLRLEKALACSSSHVSSTISWMFGHGMPRLLPASSFSHRPWKQSPEHGCLHQTVWRECSKDMVRKGRGCSRASSGPTESSGM